jgi:hypothetical protein
VPMEYSFEAISESFLRMVAVTPNRAASVCN